MTSPHGPLTRHLVELATLVNRQTADLPDDVLRRDCALRLNGRAYHEHMGRPATDPLVRLVGCGPAGYRFVLAALRYALGDPRLSLDEETLDEREEAGARSVQVRGRLTGRLRDTGEPFAAECALVLHGDASSEVTEIAATLGDADVERILAARRA